MGRFHRCFHHPSRICTASNESNVLFLLDSGIMGRHLPNGEKHARRHTHTRARTRTLSCHHAAPRGNPFDKRDRTVFLTFFSFHGRQVRSVIMCPYVCACVLESHRLNPPNTETNPSPTTTQIIRSNLHYPRRRLADGRLRWQSLDAPSPQTHFTRSFTNLWAGSRITKATNSGGSGRLGRR